MYHQPKPLFYFIEKFCVAVTMTCRMSQ